MTCRDEVLTAFETLCLESDRVDFAPIEVLKEMRSAGSTYKDSTIRTHVVSHMVEDGTLVRSGPGRYRLARHRERLTDTPPSPPEAATERISEDAVKSAMTAHLEADGWSATVAWGRQRGIYIDARRGDECLIIEAKGAAPAGPQQVNYFLGALGELVQRMNDPTADYGLVFPDNRQYRGLVERLPMLARERLGLRIWFVDRNGEVAEV